MVDKVSYYDLPCCYFLLKKLFTSVDKCWATLPVILLNRVSDARRKCVRICLCILWHSVLQRVLQSMWHHRELEDVWLCDVQLLSGISFMMMSTFLAWLDLFHTGQQYLPVEEHTSSAVLLRTNGLACHLLPVSILRRLFMGITFCLVLRQWCLYVCACRYIL